MGGKLKEQLQEVVCQICGGCNYRPGKVIPGCDGIDRGVAAILALFPKPKGIHFHSHPGMEGKLGVPHDHVIIDRESFDKINAYFGAENKGGYYHGE